MEIRVIPMDLPTHLHAYARGETDVYPNIGGVKKKDVQKMLRFRRNYIRQLLVTDPRKAHTLPDFNQLMSEEIWSYAKNELRPVLFKEWDDNIKHIRLLWDEFYRENAKLNREYKDAIDSGRPFIKHRYLSITAKRRAFAVAIRDPKTLAEIELTCLGETRYGIPDL